MKPFQTIHFKIGVFYTLILSVILLLYSSIVIAVSHHTLIRDIDRGLAVKSRELSELVDAMVKIQLDPAPAYRISSLGAASQRIVELHRMSPAQAATALELKVLEIMDRYEFHNDYFAIMDSEGRLVASSHNTPPELKKILLEKIIAALKTAAPFSTLRIDSRRLRLITTRVQPVKGASYFIQIASSMETVSRAEHKLFWVMVFILPVMLVAAVFTGRLFSSQILKPIGSVAKAAGSISHEDLSHRVPVTHTDDEMQELVQAFNEMLERLEKSFGHISEFSTHVAHELKTPLAVIRGEAEVALRRERSTGEYRAALEANLRETERMVRTIDDMLLLARVDYDPQSLRFEKINFVSFLRDILEKEKMLAEKKQIQITDNLKDGAVEIPADETHLRRLFFNIFENAVKFTPPQGRIELDLKLAEKTAAVTIRDSGPGIAPADLPHIFDKFFHKEPGGNGLGLSIALAIARAHRGTLTAESPAGNGAAFTVTLPLSLQP